MRDGDKLRMQQGSNSESEIVTERAIFFTGEIAANLRVREKGQVFLSGGSPRRWEWQSEESLVHRSARDFPSENTQCPLLLNHIPIPNRDLLIATAPSLEAPDQGSIRRTLFRRFGAVFCGVSGLSPVSGSGLGVVGRGFEGGTRRVIGVCVGVAFGWSAVFLFLMMRSSWVRSVLASRFGVVKIALLYGPFIWMVMSLAVIPILAHRAPTIGIRWWIQLIGHFPFVGIPIVASSSRRTSRASA
jgi:hypothetical protein